MLDCTFDLREESKQYDAAGPHFSARLIKILYRVREGIFAE
jgi:hypothetical protein